jgi:hypothetical protein
MIRQNVRIGDLLLEENLITQEKLNEVLHKQQQYKTKGIFKKLGELLIEEGIVSEQQLDIVLAKQLNFCLLYTSPSPRD